VKRRAGAVEQFAVDPVTPAESSEWIYGSDRIRHRSGRFFSIVGLEFAQNGKRPDAEILREPIIDQPEVGLLGFVIHRDSRGTRVLVQRKLEPGNVRGLQIAPTCQATVSNLERIHGGASPPGAEFFGELPAGALVLADSLQSEQGTRFFRKRNRNITVELTRTAEPLPSSLPSLRWIGAKRLLAMMTQHHRVNPDARSVFVCTPWSSWADGDPFSRHNKGLGLLLREAYEAVVGAQLEERARDHLRWLAEERGRLATDPPRFVPLEELKRFTVDSAGLTGPPGADWDDRHFAVRIPSRERPSWDQPLVVSRGPGVSVLCAFHRGKDLRFVFRAASEPGLHDEVELQTTFCREPGGNGRARVHLPFELLTKRRPALAEVWQSEEGGRFYRERVLHRIVLIEDPGIDLPDHHRDIGLREVEALAIRGVFTNQSRTTLSLLLGLL
jgi:oxidase EvaA